MASSDIVILNTIEEYTTHYGIPSVGHPLLSIHHLEGQNCQGQLGETTQMNLYAIVVRQGPMDSSRYGWRTYDFSKGLMSFFAPGQIMQWDYSGDVSQGTGWLLVFHPDFVRRYPLGAQLAKYKFFGYENNEALHLSDAERQLVEAMLSTMYQESRNTFDEHSQHIIVSQLGVLLTYAERFYQRQFRTRFSVEADLVTRFQTLLQQHFEQEQRKLVTAAELASELAMSTHYLAELLRNLTGMNTQQHIHAYLLEQAKSLLLRTNLSVNEVAYRLGFEYPQYFNRLFKRKTGQTPLEYRSLN